MAENYADLIQKKEACQNKMVFHQTPWEFAPEGTLYKVERSKTLVFERPYNQLLKVFRSDFVIPFIPLSAKMRQKAETPSLYIGLYKLYKLRSPR